VLYTKFFNLSSIHQINHNSAIKIQPQNKPISAKQAWFSTQMALLRLYRINRQKGCNKLVNYQADVKKEAKSFLQNHEDDVKQAIKDGEDWSYNLDFMDSSFHSEIVDQSYSLEDAAFIVENSDNTEEDSGLWEGQQPRDAIVTQAAYSFGNDVYTECERIYDEMKQEFEDSKLEEDDEKNENVDVDEENDKILTQIFNETATDKLQAVAKGSEDEQELIEKWLRLNANAGMWSGYPVGSSYIDARCGSGHSMPDIKDYVDFDHEFAQQVPHLSGKYKDAVKTYYEETFSLKQTQ